jgi:methylglyoxal synthase
MEDGALPIGQRKRIALIAHDSRKQDLVDWARFNRHVLTQHKILATGATGRLLEQVLDIEITKLQSGPLGGDQQIGAKIADGEVDFDLFLGSAGSAASRRGRQGLVTACRRLEYPYRLQSGICRFHVFFAADDTGV